MLISDNNKKKKVFGSFDYLVVSKDTSYYFQCHYYLLINTNTHKFIAKVLVNIKCLFYTKTIITHGFPFNSFKLLKLL